MTGGQFLGLTVVYGLSLYFILSVMVKEFRRERFNFHLFFSLLFVLTFYFGVPAYRDTRLWFSTRGGGTDLFVTSLIIVHGVLCHLLCHL